MSDVLAILWSFKGSSFAAVTAPLIGLNFDINLLGDVWIRCSHSAQTKGSKILCEFQWRCSPAGWPTLLTLLMRYIASWFCDIPTDRCFENSQKEETSDVITLRWLQTLVFLLIAGHSVVVSGMSSGIEISVFLKSFAGRPLLTTYIPDGINCKVEVFSPYSGGFDQRTKISGIRMNNSLQCLYVDLTMLCIVSGWRRSMWIKSALRLGIYRWQWGFGYQE